METNNFVDANDIMEYSKRNTSPKMPIESKFVNAFLRGIFSDCFNDVTTKIKNKFSYEPGSANEFILITSLYPKLSSVSNLDKYVPLIAYSMKRKDRFVMEKLCELFFGTTEGFEQYSNYEKYKEITNTDENPVNHTDENSVTDYNNGQIYFSYPSMCYFNGYYAVAISGVEPSDKATTDEIISSLKNYSFNFETDIKKLISLNNDFYTLITVIKPARVGIIYDNSSIFILATEYYFAKVSNQIVIKKYANDMSNMSLAFTRLGVNVMSSVDASTTLSNKQRFICNLVKRNFSVSAENYNDSINDFEFSVIKDNMTPVNGATNEKCSMCKINVKLNKSHITMGTNMMIDIKGTNVGSTSTMKYKVPVDSLIQNTQFDTEYITFGIILILRTA